MTCKSCHGTGQRHFGTREESDCCDCNEPGCDAAERRAAFERRYHTLFGGLCTLRHWEIYEMGRKAGIESAQGEAHAHD